MQVSISFRHMDPSEPLKKYAEHKVRRVISKYIQDNVDTQVTLGVQKFRHNAHFLVNYKGLSIKIEETTEDMYSSIDRAMDKLERQIRRYKDKLRQHKHSAQGRDQFFELSVIRPPVDDELAELVEEEEAAIQEAPPDPEEENKTDNILTREVLTAKPMNVDDAVMQLDLEQRDFLVFTNDETDKLSVVYRRSDGNFGLIEPQTG